MSNSSVLAFSSTSIKVGGTNRRCCCWSYRSCYDNSCSSRCRSNSLHVQYKDSCCYRSLLTIRSNYLPYHIYYIFYLSYLPLLSYLFLYLLDFLYSNYFALNILLFCLLFYYLLFAKTMLLYPKHNYSLNHFQMVFLHTFLYLMRPLVVVLPNYIHTHLV